MKYKAIFIDLDGTLLNSLGSISRFTVKAIKKAQKKGVLVVINSGRTPSEIERILHKASLILPYIALNGAYIRIMEEKKTIGKRQMDYPLCEEMLRICKKYDNNSFLYTAHYSYAYHLQKYPKLSKYGFLQYLYENVMLLGKRFVRGGEIEKLFSQKVTVYKCGLLCANQIKLAAMRKEIDELGRFETASTSPVFLECNLKGVTKGSGLTVLLKYYNLLPKEAIAIGDSENDLPMLQVAGLGIAMENAAKKVKQTAKLIADTNNHHGVAKVINHYF